jgi:hypothetical protein
MTKKPRSAKQLANDERLRQAAREKKESTPEVGQMVQEPVEKQDPVAPQVNPSDYEDLQKQVAELRQMLTANPQALAPQMTSRGFVGTVERYLVDPANYPDPRDRLSEEGRLRPYAFKENYELEYDVSVSSYETIDNVRMKEPKFTLKLNRVILDEDTGEPTNQRYTVFIGIFHEDPDAAIIVARENGLEVDESNEKAFLDEMRYLRFRNWLLEAFYPAKPAQDKINKRETVIGNRLVEIFEVNSESPEAVMGRLENPRA